MVSVTLHKLPWKLIEPGVQELTLPKLILGHCPIVQRYNYKQAFLHASPLMCFLSSAASLPTKLQRSGHICASTLCLSKT